MTPTVLLPWQQFAFGSFSCLFVFSFFVLITQVGPFHSAPLMWSKMEIFGSKQKGSGNEQVVMATSQWASFCVLPGYYLVVFLVLNAFSHFFVSYAWCIYWISIWRITKNNHNNNLFQSSHISANFSKQACKLFGLKVDVFTLNPLRPAELLRREGGLKADVFTLNPLWVAKLERGRGWRHQICQHTAHGLPFLTVGIVVLKRPKSRR